jgi:DNA-binding transcriptional MocR family regulator
MTSATRTRSRAATAVDSGVIDELFAAAQSSPGLISFGAGSPDPALLPTEVIGSLADAALAEYGAAALQYGMTSGFAPLREHARGLLAARGVVRSAGEIHIGTGATGALHTICMATLDPGDVVLVEEPTYAPALKAFRGFGATAVGVACDDSGMVVDALDSAIARYRPAFVYVMPTFQNPTGRTMPAQRRADLAAVIQRRNTLVVEDDVYHDLRYRGNPIPALASYAPDHCVYLTSLSKTVAPALRVGIASMPTGLLSDVLALKQIVDMQTSSLGQAIAAEFLAGPGYPAHLRRLADAYTAKLATLTSALTAHLGPDFRWREPDGGLFLWVEGPESLDAEAALRAALDHGVAYLPGAGCYAADAGRHANTMRLSFSTVSVEDIERGVALLADVVGSR